MCRSVPRPLLAARSTQATCSTKHELVRHALGMVDLRVTKRGDYGDTQAMSISTDAATVVATVAVAVAVAVADTQG